MSSDGIHKSDSVKVDELIEEASQIRNEEPARAEKIAREALELAVACGYRKGEGQALGALAFAERTKGNFVESLEMYQEVKRIFEALDMPDKLAMVYNNIGINYVCVGNFSQALEAYHESLKLHERLGNTSGIARVSNNIGVVYDNIDNSSKAIEYFKEALAINEKQGNTELIAKNYTNIGVTNRNLKNYTEALSYFQKAVKIHELDNNRADLALNYGNLGVVYEDMQQYDLALSYAKKALALSEEAGDKDMIAFNAGTVGNTLTCLKQYDEALVYFNKSLQTAQQINSLKWQSTAYHSLVAYHEVLGNYKEALHCYRKGHEVDAAQNKEEVHRKAITMDMQKKLAAEEAVRHATEKILHNILPQKIAERIKTGDEEIIERYENCSVLFADIVGFTTWSAAMEVKELARHLNKLFQIFDELANRFGVEKIKTIGDAYMCVAGLPEPCEDHAERIANMALSMLVEMENAYPNEKLRLRIGIHSGEVIAGILGKNKYAYDLWGDTVNTASRMESHSLENKIQVTEAFKNLVGAKFTLEERGEIEVKGKGKMKTWFLLK